MIDIKRAAFCLSMVLLGWGFTAKAGDNITYNELTDTAAAKVLPGAERLWLKQDNSIPDFISFGYNNQPGEQKFFNMIRTAFKLPANYGFKLTSDEYDQIGWEHKRYQLTVNNVPVTNGNFVVHLKDGKVLKYNGSIFKNIAIGTSPAMSEASALSSALQNIGATTYKWQIPGEEENLKLQQEDATATYYPKGVLEIAQPDGNAASNDFRLVYRFDIYAQQPLGRWYVYVDAQTGKVIEKTNRICTANTAATAYTAYRGARAINTDSYNGSYRLRDVTRGSGIYTYNMHTGTSYGAATDFTNSTTTWYQGSSSTDRYAGDAHFGGEMTYDFYQSMGRNSIDNNGFRLLLYVHYDQAYFNAFWDGQEMNFGDGSGGYTPLTSLDITGHEISHGLDQYTANLNYQDESGALNESFSDVFGTAVEWFADSSRGNWLIGEDIGTAFRSMSNPNTYQQPDTYHGTYWYTGSQDNGGVHTNSGVQNHWYYRVAQGGSGTNDIGNAFNVTGIGRTKATQIAWRNMVYYLTSSAQYADARYYSIQAATDLFGSCSQEVITTTKAWYAVGVGADFTLGVQAHFTYSQSTGCSVPFTVNFTNTTTNGTSYVWYFGDGATSTATNPTHTYTTFGTYTVKLVASGGSCGNDSIIMTNLINVNAANACVVILPTSGSAQTQTACNGTVYDDGGPNGAYNNNVTSTVTIAPTGASQVKLHFTRFRMENTYDFLYVYDGPTTGSTLIGSYTGYTVPADITSSGSSITIRESTDPGVVDTGFAINWTCIQPSSPPVANFVADATQTCSGVVNFTDQSTNGASSWAWTFGDGGTSTQQNPTHTYTANGTYTVTLTATNNFGNNTKTRTSYIVVSKPSGPSVATAQRCGPGSLTLNASTTDSVNWYDAGGNLVSSANPYTTPSLSSTATYSVEQIVPQAIQHAGPADSTLGAGGIFISTTQRALRFSVNKACTLVSVLVYAQQAGWRTIQYRDTLGNLIQEKQFNIPVGASRLNVNFDLIPGGPYELGLRDTQSLYRNSVGANYPYNDPAGLVSITGNNINPYTPSYYYFFYDWQLQAKPCISQRTQVSATINPVVSVTANPTNVACYGTSSGSVSATASGGTPAFSYSWSGGGSNSTKSNLGPGSYTVTVTDTKGCSATATATVTQPSSALSASVSATAANCSATGTANVTASGGTASYSYTWSNGSHSANITGLTAGSYSVTVTDSHGCSTTASTTVTGGGGGGLNITPNHTDAGCHGSANGTATVAPNGTPPYQYLWSNGATTSALTGLAAGSYTVSVTDASGCSATSTINIAEPTAISVTSNTTTPASCGQINGTASIVATGGAPGYSYAWSNGQSGASITGLGAGNYLVTITDANGCTAADNAVVNSSSGLAVASTVGDVSCNGLQDGSINLTVTGGTPGYTYSWGSGSTATSLTGLAAGTYMVTVTDNSNCQNVATIQVSEPSPLHLLATSNNTTCFGDQNGSAEVKIAGGTPVYTVLWSNGSTDTSITGLAAGAYTVTATDAHSCTATYTVNITQPTEVGDSLVTVNTPQGQSNGQASVYPLGGHGPYHVLWANGDSATALTNLAAGSYEFTITDANGCSKTDTAVITNAVGIEQVSAGINADIYPNPTTGMLHVHLNLPATQAKLSLEVKDLLGQTLMLHQLDASKDQDTNISLDSFASGIYFIEIHFGDKWMVKKVVLSK